MQCVQFRSMQNGHLAPKKNFFFIYKLNAMGNKRMTIYSMCTSLPNIGIDYELGMRYYTKNKFTVLLWKRRTKTTLKKFMCEVRIGYRNTDKMLHATKLNASITLGRFSLIALDIHGKRALELFIFFFFCHIVSEA